MNEVVLAAANRFLLKGRGRTPQKPDDNPKVHVPDAPPVAARQSPGSVPARVHARQPQKGRPNATQ